MSMTVVGVFESAREAKTVHADLVQAGIAAESIEAYGQDSHTGRAAADAADKEGSGNGLSGWLQSIFGSEGGAEGGAHAGTYSEAVRRGGYLVSVVTDDTAQAHQIERIMDQDGAIDLDERAQQWRNEGRTDYREDAPATSGHESEREHQSRAGESGRIPVVKEELAVGKREQEQGHVRVTSRVITRPVEAQVTLHEEHAEIERHAVDRPASEADLHAGLQGQTIEVREYAEEPVVAKTARVVEEVEVGKRASERTEVVRDDVRETVVEVEGDDRETTRKAGR